MIIPAETIVLDTSVRAACFPQARSVLLPSDHFTGPNAAAHYNAQFNVWCCMKDGTVTVRDSREAELGTDPATRAYASPVHRWEVLHSVLFPSSFPNCIIAIVPAEEVWIGFSDGPIRVFEVYPPYRLKAELGVQTNKGAPNHLTVSQDGAIVAAACGDDHVTIFHVPSHEVVVRLLGHSNAVKSSTFLGFTHILVTTGVDGVLCLWDLDSDTADTPIARVDITPGLCVTSLLSLPVTGDDVRSMLSVRPSMALNDLLDIVPDDNWIQLWVGCETGDLLVYVVSVCRGLSIAEFFAEPFRRLHRTAGVTSLSVGPSAVIRTVIGTSSKSTKVFRYNAVTFETLPALSASTVDGSLSVGSGAYPPTPIGPATVLPVWSIDSSGRMTQLTLERAGTVGAEADQREAARIQMAVLKKQIASLSVDLEAHNRLLSHISNPPANPALAAAAADAVVVRRKIEHLHRSAIKILEHQVDNKLRVRYYRMYVLWYTHRKHLALRRSCAALLKVNHTIQRDTAFNRWAFGASVMKLRRIRTEAAVNLCRIISRSIIASRFAAWRSYQGKRNALKRLHHLLSTTATRKQQHVFVQWRKHAKIAMALKAKASMLNCLLRQVASGLRAVYFGKWIQLRSQVAVKASLRRTAHSCVGTLVTASEDQLKRHYFRKWLNYPPIASTNRSKVNACKFLISSCDGLIRRRMFNRWQTVARLRVARRSSAGANSTLMRLTETGTRAAYFRRWKAAVQLRMAATRGTATAGGAIAFITSRSNRALTETYYRKWTRYAASSGAVRRQRSALDIFLRQTRLGRLLHGYHRWQQVVIHRREQRQRNRTAQLLSRSSTDGLRRTYFATWRRSIPVGKRSRRREGVLQTFSRQSNSSLLRIYFGKWHTMRLMVRHLNEVALYMRNSGQQRLKKLRSLYFGKWLSWTTRRAIQRKRERTIKNASLSHANDDLVARIAALKDRIDSAKHQMNAIIRDEEAAVKRAEEHESHAADCVIAEGQLDRRIATQHAQLERVGEQVNRYAYTLMARRAHPVELASGWRDAWLRMSSQLHGLSTRGAATPITFGEYATSLSQLREACLALRNNISRDVADHLAVKRAPPENLKSPVVRRRPASQPPPPAPRSG